MEGFFPQFRRCEKSGSPTGQKRGALIFRYPPLSVPIAEQVAAMGSRLRALLKRLEGFPETH